MRCSMCKTRDIDAFPRSSKNRKFTVCKTCLMKRRRIVEKDRLSYNKFAHMSWRARLVKEGGYDLDGKVSAQINYN